jgi:hypothetical protein
MARGKEGGSRRVRSSTSPRRSASCILDAAGVDGAFLCEFVTAEATTSDQPRYDMDLNAFSLVKTYRHGKGVTYPDMSWEPKQSFSAVADFYSRLQDQDQTALAGK